MKRAAEVEALIQDIASRLRRQLEARAADHPLMVGIHTGGVWIAERLHRILELTEPLGSLDISFYRDDYTRIGVNPQVRPSNLPFDVDDRHIVLVDDVLHTGRTIRAALNEIFDYGRPSSVTLVTLVERDGRELPIQPDITGVHLDLHEGQHVKLTGPEPLDLILDEDTKRGGPRG